MQPVITTVGVAVAALLRDFVTCIESPDDARLAQNSVLHEKRHGGELIAMCVREAGKSIPDSIAELREAVDFLRYYGAQLRREFGTEVVLRGPTGESNVLRLRGRGVFACVSPWNFPLAIFAGQVCAALAAGNAVLAKPAEQTPLVAARAVRLLHEAGVPADVLHFLPGDGAAVGGRMTADPRVAGVAFTGSCETVQLINRALAARSGALATLIGETGGQNVMLADSSALPEQVVNDVLYSGLNSAGQRCSALRVLLVQEEIAPRVIELLAGAMDLLKVGDPSLLSTDVGPVIDMKYIVIVGDGMADRPLDELGGMTPLQKAATPNMDRLAATSILGKVRTVPEGMHPGSDVANLSILGYDPVKYYSGRAPLEAASIGVDLREQDVAFRCNLVTLRYNKDRTGAVMEDYSSGHITTEEAKELVLDINENLDSSDISSYPGVSYRHIMVWSFGASQIECTAPHDITGKEIADYLPVGDGEDVLRDLMLKSVGVLEGHPVNRKRMQGG